MNYTKQYFIDKFNAIPEEKWYNGGSLQNPVNPECGCALFHCGVKEEKVFDLTKYVPTEEAIALINILSENRYKEIEEPQFQVVYRINDNSAIDEISPKQAMLEALENLK